MTLEQEGFTVRTYTDGESALQGLTARPVDLAVLDIKMPRMDGMELLQRLRQRSAVPVIFLTSKDEEVDELMGLRLGADDYITKPFSQRLLIERIRALLRRNETSRAEGSGAVPGGVMVRGDLVLDETKHQCTWRGHDIQLTVTEFLLVKALAARPGMVKSRDQLIDAAYGENIYVDDRTIDSHIKRVRKKFRAIDDSFDQIETLYGIGYRYKEQCRGACPHPPRRTKRPDACRLAVPDSGVAAAQARRLPASTRRWVSPLLRRILLVNALPLALLVAALLYLDQYQNGPAGGRGAGAARAGAHLRRRAGRKRGRARPTPTTRSWCPTWPARCCAA